MNTKRDIGRFALLTVFLASFSVRVFAIGSYLCADERALTMHRSFLYEGSRLSHIHKFLGDRDRYNTVASNIYLFGEPGKTGGRPPLYPLFLALSYALFGYSVFGFFAGQLLLASLVAVLVYLFAKEAFGSKTAFLAALFYIFNPHFILLSIQLYSETLYFLILIIFFRLCHKIDTTGFKTGNGILLGMTAGAAALCRNTFLVFMPFLLVWLAGASFNRKRPVFTGTAAFLLAFILIYGPWVAYSQEDVIIPLAASFSESAWKAETVSEETSMVVRPENLGDEVSGFFDMVRGDTGSFLGRILKQFRYFALTPSAKGVSKRHEVISGLIFFIFYPLGIFGLAASCKKRDRIGYLALLFVTSSVIFHSFHYLTLFDGELRYRLPVEFILMIFAAFGIGVLADSSYGRKKVLDDRRD